MIQLFTMQDVSSGGSGISQMRGGKRQKRRKTFCMARFSKNPHGNEKYGSEGVDCGRTSSVYPQMVFTSNKSNI